MLEKLREVVAKATSTPDQYAALELDYLRGHGLSGMTRLRVTADGAYELTSAVTADEKERTWSGKLDPADRDALLVAIRDELLDASPSTRNIKDDEEPIIIKLRYETMAHELRVWHDDAGAAGLAGFEAHVVALTKKLSGGAIITIPAS